MIRRTSKLIFFFISISFFSTAQQHPKLWITNDEKAEILLKIEQNDWAKDVVNTLHRQVDKKRLIHQKSPEIILGLIPDFAKTDHQYNDAVGVSYADPHNNILSVAASSGMLYYLTGDVSYAKLAVDILGVYTDTIAPKTPQTTTICGNAFYDPRFTYNQYALTYDFIYNYLKSDSATVYNIKLKKRVPFDNAKAQKAIANMVGNTLQEYGKPDVHGKFISNHPILTAPGVLFGILCIENEAEKERLFNVFWEKGTAHQNSFKNTILPMFGKQGIWPESTSYSFMSYISLVLNVVDRIYPAMNVTRDFKQILYGNFFFDHLRLPDNRFVRYGDSKRNNDSTKELYLFALNIAHRRGYKDLESQAFSAFYNSLKASKKLSPLNENEEYNNYDALRLFWGIAGKRPDKKKSDFRTPTVIVEHAGVALQRNHVEKNNELYGLCGIIGGAHYVHSHATGITLELYGAGYVMAPNAGLPATVAERLIPVHENYYRLYAGNNTVIVNGTSHGRDEGSWKGGAHVWQNNAINVAAEPQHLEKPVSKHFNFATQFLKDEVNNCEQERTLSIIRTSDTTAYYFDMFRSKSMNENKFHDYVYHNIGDTMLLANSNNKSLNVFDTDRYQNDIGDKVQSPGWRFFENAMVSAPTSGAIKVRFDVRYDNKYMHAFVPGGVAREYTKALTPPTREALNGYKTKKTQLLVVRQQGEAWNAPFIAVFEPSVNTTSSVQSIEQLKDGNKVVGAKVVSKLGDKIVTDYIICQDNAASTYSNKKLKLQFNGRFGIVRTEKLNRKTTVSLYIGEGKSLRFKNKVLSVDDQQKGYVKL